MQKLLVTGAAGFIGSNFVHYWHANNPDDRIVVLDALTYAGNRHNIDGLMDQQWFSFYEGNICDLALVESLLAEHDIDSIVHFAAESHVDRSITNPMEFIMTNVVGTVNLLNAAKNQWKGNEDGKLFYHVSTDEVYGSLGEEGFFTEQTPYDPSSPYSASKASSDHLVRAWNHTYSLPTLITNCSNNYGPYQFPEKLIPLMIINCINNNELPIYGDGKNIRDWLYVEDHCEALYAVLKRGKSGETYNIGGNEEQTNLNIVNIICEILDDNKPSSKLSSYKELITYVKDRPGHDFRYAIDASKIKNELGWQPKYNFKDAISNTIDWYLENKNWWDKILNNKYNLERLGDS